MAEQSADVMEDLGSRNASIKRAHDADDADSARPTPRKRARRARRRKQADQPVEKVVPAEGSFNVNVVSLNELEDKSDLALKQPAEIGAAPSVNWNAGTKATIRTTLGVKKQFAGES